MRRPLLSLFLCLLAPLAFAGSALVADQAWVREAPPGALRQPGPREIWTGSAWVTKT